MKIIPQWKTELSGSASRQWPPLQYPAWKTPIFHQPTACPLFCSTKGKQEKLCSSNTVQTDHCTTAQNCRVLFLFWLIPLIFTLLRTRISWSINTSLHKTLCPSDEKQNKSCLTFISHLSPWSWHSLCNPSTAKYPHFTGGGSISLTNK